MVLRSVAPTAGEVGAARGWRYDAASKRVHVELTQTQAAGAFRIPLEIAIGSATRNHRIEKIELTAATDQFAFLSDVEPTSVTLDPNTWVLMQVETSSSADRSCRAGL